MSRGTQVGDGQVGAIVAVEVGRHERNRETSPAANRIWGWNVPSPLPRGPRRRRSCRWRSPGRRARCRSRMPRVPRHAPDSVGLRRLNVPLPLFRRTVTLSEFASATARSSTPSPVKSPATRAEGPEPTAIVRESGTGRDCCLEHRESLAAPVPDRPDRRRSGRRGRRRIGRTPSRTVGLPREGSVRREAAFAVAHENRHTVG